MQQLVLIIAIITLAVGTVCLIDLWHKPCSIARRILWSPIPFIPFLGPMIYYSLFDPPPVRQVDVPVPRNAIEQWKEWLANRYNPGFFTGGQIHPMYRATGVNAGILFLISGIIGISFVLFAIFGGHDQDGRGMLVFQAVVSVILIFAGVAKIGEGKKKGKQRNNVT